MLEQQKSICCIYAPYETYSGYGANSRDKIKTIIELKGEEWNIKLIPCRWGMTPLGFVDDHKDEWGFLDQYKMDGELNFKPDIMIWITIPSEAQAVGNYNILITAGIETTFCDPSWIEGINRMDLTITSSEFSKQILLNSKFDKRDKTNNQLIDQTEVKKPIEVCFEGCSTEKYYAKNSKDFDIDSIKEDFCFLCVGNWLQGGLGQDRKNIGLTVKAFYEVFKNKKNKPALILKTSGGSSSYPDRDEILEKINFIKESCPSQDLPTVYLLHGDLLDEEINALYNHPKVKAMVSFTKGEGFGRPLLEFSMVKKPIIASNWSGHLDYLKPEFTTLVNGTLTNVDQSALVPNIILEGSQWFSVDTNHAGSALKTVFEDYKSYKEKAVRQAYYTKSNFSLENMKEKLKLIFDNNIPILPKITKLVLPQLLKHEG